MNSAASMILSWECECHKQYIESEAKTSNFYLLMLYSTSTSSVTTTTLFCPKVTITSSKPSVPDTHTVEVISVYTDIYLSIIGLNPIQPP